jgi:hypothetical protein
MTSHQARLMLQACRPGGEDAQDPFYAEALAQVHRDPELARWFEAEQELDAAIAAKLKCLPLPADLKADILAGGTATGFKPRWRQARLATAAAVALLLAVAATWLRAPAPPEFAAFRDETLGRAITEPEHLAFASRNLADIRQWLRGRGIKGDIDLPAGLSGLTIHGCRIMDWNGEKVALICLVPEGKPHVDMLVIDRIRFRNFTPPVTPAVGRSGELAIAVWKRGGKTYLLAGKMDTDQLRALL